MKDKIAKKAEGSVVLAYQIRGVTWDQAPTVTLVLFHFLCH